MLIIRKNIKTDSYEYSQLPKSNFYFIGKQKKNGKTIRNSKKNCWRVFVNQQVTFPSFGHPLNNCDEDGDCQDDWPNGNYDDSYDEVEDYTGQDLHDMRNCGDFNCLPYFRKNDSSHHNALNYGLNIDMLFD